VDRPGGRRAFALRLERGQKPEPRSAARGRHGRDFASRAGLAGWSDRPPVTNADLADDNCRGSGGEGVLL